MDFACRVCGISALGITGTHSHLCIVDYKYRNAVEKNPDIFGKFSSQKVTCPNDGQFSLPCAQKWQ